MSVRHASVVVAALLAAMQTQTRAPAQSAQIEIRALTNVEGPLGPGLGPGVVFESLGSAGRDESGRIAFRAGIDWGVGLPYDDAIFLDDAKGRRVVERASDGPLGFLWLRHFDTQLLITERLVWNDPVILGSRAVYRAWFSDGTSAIVAEEGATPPGAPPGFVMLNINLAVNGVGEILVQSDLENFSTYESRRDFGVWEYTAAGLTPVMLAGAAVETTAIEGTASRIYSVSLNDLGRRLISLEVTPEYGSDRTCFFELHGDGGLTPIVIEGQPIPGDPNGTPFTSGGASSQGNYEHFMVYAGIQCPGACLYYGAFERRDGQLREIARSLDPAPGFPGWFINFYPTTNSHGDIVMTTSMSHTPGDVGLHRALWRVDGDQLTLLLKYGDALPSTPPGYSIKYFGSCRVLESRDILVSARLQNAAGDEFGGQWLMDPVGNISLVIRSGQPVEVGPNDIRIADSSYVLPNETDGVSVTTLHFADGSEAIAEVRVQILCAGDVNGDNTANMADLVPILDAFNTAHTDPNYNLSADLNRDARVDFTDLNIILAHFNQSCR